MPIEIYLADPITPAIEMRLVEEELRLDGTKPKVGQGGLQRFLRVVLDDLERRRRPDTVKLGLFTHYPTFTLMIIDDKYLFYPYGYALLGNASPVFELWEERPDPRVIEFLDKQYDRVKESSADASAVVRTRREGYRPKREELYSAAVFFIPPAGTRLYQFGSHVLGYDIREQDHSERFSHSPWQEYVGAARAFGFHLTVCDVLYFLNEISVELAIADLELLASQLRPFELTNLELRQAFPDDKAIALSAEALSGELEVLHCELVCRVYRSAAASNYSLELAAVARDRDLDRARLMMDRYRVPYVLHRFRPHFSLLTNVTAEDQARLFAEIRDELSQQEVGDSVRVDRLAVVTQPEPGGLWEIKKEIELGG